MPTYEEASSQQDYSNGSKSLNRKYDVRRHQPKPEMEMVWLQHYLKMTSLKWQKSLIISRATF